MKTDRRTQLREVIFLLLFRLDFYESSELESQIKDFFEGEEEFTDDEMQYISNKVLTIANMSDEIDNALNEVSIGWKVKRMARVDLTILRLAYFEIKFDKDVPVPTAINEAVELAKSYGEENSPSFVNGILAKVVKQDGK